MLYDIYDSCIVRKNAKTILLSILFLIEYKDNEKSKNTHQEY